MLSVRSIFLHVEWVLTRIVFLVTYTLGYLVLGLPKTTWHVCPGTRVVVVVKRPVSNSFHPSSRHPNFLTPSFSLLLHPHFVSPFSSPFNLSHLTRLVYATLLTMHIADLLLDNEIQESTIPQFPHCGA